MNEELSHKLTEYNIKKTKIKSLKHSKMLVKKMQEKNIDIIKGKNIPKKKYIYVNDFFPIIFSKIIKL